MTSDLHRYLARQPGRCGLCTWHTATQGHRPDCPKQAAANGRKPALTWDNGGTTKDGPEGSASSVGSTATAPTPRDLTTPDDPGVADD